MNAQVLIPHYNSGVSDEYVHEGIVVHRYAEPSVVDRSLIMGRRKPDGLAAFAKLLQSLQPDVVHFHGLGGSNGITYHHVSLAKELGYKVVFTFHIAGLSCFTGTLIYQEKVACNGYASPIKCTRCVYQAKNLSAVKTHFLKYASQLGYSLGYDASRWQNSLGTAIGFPFVIKQRKKILQQLAQDCDQLIVLTNWYKKVLDLNGISSHKLLYLPQALPPQEQRVDDKNTLPTSPILKMVFVGRIVYSKGLHLLLEVVKQLDPQRVELHIYGQLKDEEYAAGCKKIIDAHPHITWKGVLQPGDVVATLSQYDVLCIPSVICEMSPLVIQEAFAAGIPVIASDVYGNAEQIEHGKNGWLFPFKNATALFKIVNDLLLHPEKFSLAKTNLPPVSSFTNLAQKHLQLYHTLTQQAVS